MRYNSPYHTPIKMKERLHLHNKTKKATGKRYRSAGTQTVTRTKKEEKIHGDDLHSGITNTGYKVVINPKQPKSVSRGVAFEYDEVVTKIMKADSGTQAVVTPVYFGTSSQSLVESGAVGIDYGAQPTLSAVSYINLNANAVNTGSSLYPSKAKPSTTKIFLSHSSVNLRVSNVTSSATEVDIYVLKATSNHNLSPEVAWDTCSIAHAGGNLAATKIISNDLTQGNLGYGSSSYLDSTPLRFSQFKKFWRPVKIHHINLAASAEEKVHFTVKNNLMIDVAKLVMLNPAMDVGSAATWTTANVSCQYPRGSVAFMVVAKGSLVRDATNNVNTITTSGPEIGIQSTKRHYFKVVNENINRLDPVLGLFDINTAGNINTSQVNIVDTVQQVQRMF